ncbi:MAG: hypothetical protein K8H88_11590, partial [Sandaracinaceae bacterium]|nr:hypothetical protein [Sandaracinaceae bacterium]
ALEASAAHLIAALGEVIAKLEGTDHDRWGVSKRDRLRSGDSHPARVMLDRIGTIFGGVPELDLFVGSRGEKVVIEPGTPAAIYLPKRHERARDAGLAFLLARPIALFSRQLHVLDRLGDDAVQRLLVATVRQFEPSFSLGRPDPELDEEVRRVAKAIPWLSRGRIQEAATTFSTMPTLDIPAWAADVRRLAARAAVLVADDLIASIEALGEPLEPGSLASDLVRFWISDPATRFRRVVGQQV